ncbi:MAG TPA: nuclear transport factor 2 family protein [Acidobacteriota bacterium]|nr:nuclear transport factor 2 family protein [Acidobacteriota bacterium]
MKNLMRYILGACAVPALLLTISCAPADEIKADSYAEDRALIEDLQARYLFALDFFDMDTYVSTFTEDGILDIIAYQAKGRDEIRKRIEEARAVFNPASGTDQGPYPPTSRHNITNIVIKIDGDRATSRSYWFQYGNNNPERRAQLNSYGHYEDELVKVDGQWLFSKRVIYNEQMADWIAPAVNPAW